MKTWMRIIAVLEIIGGVFGIGLVIWLLLATPFDLFMLLLLPIPVGIYILSFVAGVGLWRGNSFGRKASIIVQAIQLPKVVCPLFTFIFSFGFDLWIHYLWYEGLSNLGFNFRFLAFYQLSINIPGPPTGLGVSVTAWIFLVMLRRYNTSSISEVDVPPPPPPAEWSENPNAAPNNRMHLTRNKLGCHPQESMVNYLCAGG